MTYTRLARKFGWDPNGDQFFVPNSKHVLFFGHIGCGKTTELRKYARGMNDSKHFYVVEVDVLSKLDRNNLQYSEAVMAMAESLFERLQGDAYDIPEQELIPLRNWFASTVNTRSAGRELTAEVKAGIEGGGGIPGLLKLVSSFTTSFKTGASRKTEWREEIRNRFTALSAAFNQFIRAVETRLRDVGRADRVLFLIDGTDKMRSEDTQQFFVYDAEQLLAIETLAIYTAPLHLKYDGRLGGKLDADIVLPMIKLFERDGSRCEAGWDAMTKMLLLRADRSLFGGESDVQHLVENCGGHPRELLRLLKLCCEVADEKIDSSTVAKAISQLAADYRYFLKPEDYVLLRRIDADPGDSGNDDRAQELLHRLALLQYNDGTWRRSHPVVRTLGGYKAIAPVQS